MKKMIATLAAGVIGLMPAVAFAQDAMTDALNRQVCGADTNPVSAEYLENGALRVQPVPGLALLRARCWPVACRPVPQLVSQPCWL